MVYRGFPAFITIHNLLKHMKYCLTGNYRYFSQCVYKVNKLKYSQGAHGVEMLGNFIFDRMMFIQKLQSLPLPLPLNNKYCV